MTMRKIYKMEDLECAHCAGLMEQEIKKLDGVKNANMNFLTQKLTLECEAENLSDIMKKVVKICRKIEPDCTVLL